MKIQFSLWPVVLCGSLICTQLVGQMGPNSRGPGGVGLFGFHMGKVVVGQPYTAEVNNTSVKTLSDGNTIQRTMTGRVARDSQGRTYSLETMTGMFGQSGTRTVIFIADPVAGYSYTLNADTKTATRRVMRGRQGAKPETRTRPQNPATVSSDLGTQFINGVTAQGKKVTHTIPAGEMGNAQPIVSTSETWFSPELQVMVSAKRFDPREGNSAYSLNNIQRTEPAGSLFQVPSDYTVNDVTPFARRSSGTIN